MATLCCLIFVYACILATSVSCHENNDDNKLMVGPREGESSRYLYKTDDTFKHCRYCDNKVAFVNTTMNKLHQETKCNSHYDVKNLKKGFSEYERANNLYPICKLGVVPGCGPPPKKELIQYCDPGYSGVVYSVYFSCVIANNETSTLSSIYYCNANLKWEIINSSYKYRRITTEKAPTTVEMAVAVEIIEKPTIKTNRTSRLSVETEEDDNVINYDMYIQTTKNEAADKDDTLQVLVIVLAGVISLMAVIVATIFVRYLYRRQIKIKTSRAGQFILPSMQSPKASPQLGPIAQEHEDGGNGEEAALIRYKSGQSCHLEVEGENADTLLYTDATKREQPIGEEKLPLKVTLPSNGTSMQPSNITSPSHSTTLPSFNNQSYNSSSPKSSRVCIIKPIEHNSHISTDSNPVPNAQNLNNPGGFSSQTASHACCFENEEYPGRNKKEPCTCPREDPIGGGSKPRYNDALEENSHNTEPKRVVSLERLNSPEVENDASFEIHPGDSGINMNVENEDFYMQSLK